MARRQGALLSHGLFTRLSRNQTALICYLIIVACPSPSPVAHLSPIAYLAIDTVAGREFLLLARIIYSPVTWRTTNPTMEDENMVNSPTSHCCCAQTLTPIFTL